MKSLSIELFAFSETQCLAIRNAVEMTNSRVLDVVRIPCWARRVQNGEEPSLTEEESSLVAEESSLGIVRSSKDLPTRKELYLSHSLDEITQLLEKDMSVTTIVDFLDTRNEEDAQRMKVIDCLLKMNRAGRGPCVRGDNGYDTKQACFKVFAVAAAAAAGVNTEDDKDAIASVNGAFVFLRDCPYLCSMPNFNQHTTRKEWLGR